MLNFPGPTYRSEKFTVTVMMTGTATPFISVGVNSHWRTALSAARSSSGIDRTTFASRTLPSGPMVASIMTTPLTRGRVEKTASDATNEKVLVRKSR